MAGRIVCAWCSADMGTTKAEGTSHGICPSCYDREIAELKNGALDAEEVFDLDELERHADAMRTSIEASLTPPMSSPATLGMPFVFVEGDEPRGQEVEGHA